MKRKGLIHVYTGEGKGKTTASMGLAIRAAGDGYKVLIAQFLKPADVNSGERKTLCALPNVEMLFSETRHTIFEQEKTPRERKMASLEKFLEEVWERAIKEKFDLLILDEINNSLNEGWINLENFLGLLEKKPTALEVVLTGRNAPSKLTNRADYVTEMLKIKHPFDQGVMARKGIEY